MTGSNVLFVDDDFWCHLENCEYLREGGLQVVEAWTASEACAVLAGGQCLTALVTDIELGDSIDGYEIARRARAAWPHLPVVYMSGTTAARHAGEGVARSQFVAKPFQPHQIVDALARATCPEAV